MPPFGEAEESTDEVLQDNVVLSCNAAVVWIYRSNSERQLQEKPQHISDQVYCIGECSYHEHPPRLTHPALYRTGLVEVMLRHYDAEQCDIISPVHLELPCHARQAPRRDKICQNQCFLQASGTDTQEACEKEVIHRESGIKDRACDYAAERNLDRRINNLKDLLI